jgi:aromatic ring-opening dioxygenase LigB subunit
MQTQVKDMKTLKDLASKEGGADFFIVLGPHGNIRSSKHISYDKETELFSVYNEIDGTVQDLTALNIQDHDYTNIGEAMKKGALYHEE